MNPASLQPPVFLFPLRQAKLKRMQRLVEAHSTSTGIAGSVAKILGVLTMAVQVNRMLFYL